MRSFAVFWICLLTSGLAGCGGSGRPALVPADGQVKLNGEPLAGAVIAFEPVADAANKFRRPASAITDAQGQFQLGTYGKGDGVPLGKYRVSITKSGPVGGYPADYNAEMANQYKFKYEWITPRELSDPATSGLTAEVTKGGLQPAVFELKREGPPVVEKPGASRVNEP